MKEIRKHKTPRRFRLVDDLYNGIPSGNITYLVALFIPLLIFITLYYARNIFPFGKNCYLRSDMYHQYAPFFSELWNKIRNGESITYSWNIGMGTNFTSLMAYYLASPTNWIIALFPQKYVIEVMNALIILKLSCSSLTMCYYLTKHFKTKKCSVAIFSIFYALSGYIAAYSWNIMWLDCILLIPLIMLGLERLVKENKGFLYCISLGLCIYTNYYISIMVCLSVILYFIVLIISYEGKKHPIIYIKKVLNWGIYSLLGGGLAACLLLPELYTFSLSVSSKISFPKKLTAYFSIVEMLVRQLINVPVHLGLEHHPNIYCGVAIFIFIPLYIMCRKINVKEKIGKCLILLLFLLSYNLNILNFIWHGLHFPNSLPCRQSFIYIFFLIAMSYEAFHHIKSIDRRQFFGALWFALIFLFATEYLFRDSTLYDFKIFYISGAFILLYAFILYLYKNKNGNAAVIMFLAFIVSISEASINMDETGFSTTSRTAYLLDFSAVDTVTDTIASQDHSFYRMDKIIGARTKNDGAWHNYRSISTFSSTSNGGMSKLYKDLGLVGSTNAYGYDGSTMVTNALFSVKYLITNHHLAQSEMLKYDTGHDGEFIYENLYTLPLGFMVPSDFAKNWTSNSVINGLDSQNDMMSSMTGVQNVFELMYDFNSESSISFSPTESGHLYLVCGNKDNETITTYIDDKNMRSFNNLKNNPHVLDLGYVQASSYVDIFADSAMSIKVYRLNEENFISAFNTLADESFQISKWSETSFKGTISAKTDGAMFLSIPYDKGWSVYIDGKKTDTYAVNNALLAVDLTAGEHTVSLKYVPVNLIKGCIITILCILLLIGIYLCKQRIAAGVIDLSKLPPILSDLFNEQDIVTYQGSAKKQSLFDDTVDMPALSEETMPSEETESPDALDTDKEHTKKPEHDEDAQDSPSVKASSPDAAEKIIGEMNDFDNL